MVAGRPVIATGYSGNLTFMNEANSYLVDYTLTKVPTGCEPYPPNAEWADPSVDHAAALMRHVFENPEDAAAGLVRREPTWSDTTLLRRRGRRSSDN